MAAFGLSQRAVNVARAKQILYGTGMLEDGPEN